MKINIIVYLNSKINKQIQFFEKFVVTENSWNHLMNSIVVNLKKCISLFKSKWLGKLKRLKVESINIFISNKYEMSPKLPNFKNSAGFLYISTLVLCKCPQKITVFCLVCNWLKVVKWQNQNSWLTRAVLKVSCLLNR